MKPLINFIESIQTKIDLEAYQFLGIGLDRYAHFALIFIIAIVLYRFRRPIWAISISSFLIISKEVADLSVILYYEPLRAEHYRDTLIDIFIGFVGLISAHFVSKNWSRWIVEKR